MKVPNYDVFPSLKIDLDSAKSVDPGEMPHSAPFHLGLHCLPKYPFRGFHNIKVFPDYLEVTTAAVVLRGVGKTSPHTLI